VKLFGHPTFDNAKPRDPAFYTPGIRARARGAHTNGIEVFAFFAAAILLAEFRTAPQHWIDDLAIAFVVVRFTYVLAYVADYPTTRTLLWNFAFLINVAIFFMPWWAR
ncbi:MAG: MAPEG family protein, partial [Pseudolabrys sp.]